MKHLLKIVAVSAALVVAGVANASTIVIVGGGSLPTNSNTVETADIPAAAFVTTTTTLGLGDTAEFTYKALQDLTVSSISIGATGSKNGVDLASLVFGFTNPPTTSLLNIQTQGGAASGTGFLPGFTMAANDTFTIFWDVTNTGPVGVSASFFTTAVPIPVPAALPLLLGGIAALGIASRKSRA